MHYYEGYVRARRQLAAIDHTNQQHHASYANQPVPVRSVPSMVDRFGLWMGGLLAAWMIRTSRRLTAERRPSLSQSL